MTISTKTMSAEEVLAGALQKAWGYRNRGEAQHAHRILAAMPDYTIVRKDEVVLVRDMGLQLVEEALKVERLRAALEAIVAAFDAYNEVGDDPDAPEDGNEYDRLGMSVVDARQALANSEPKP